MGFSLSFVPLATFLSFLLVEVIVCQQNIPNSDTPREVVFGSVLDEWGKMTILAEHNLLRGMVNNPPAANMSEMVNLKPSQSSRYTIQASKFELLSSPHRFGMISLPRKPKHMQTHAGLYTLANI